jgi:hypothetical protein
MDYDGGESKWNIKIQNEVKRARNMKEKLLN